LAMFQPENIGMDRLPPFCRCSLAFEILCRSTAGSRSLQRRTVCHECEKY
jgi:hypothetical protein